MSKVLSRFTGKSLASLLVICFLAAAAPLALITATATPAHAGETRFPSRSVVLQDDIGNNHTITVTLRYDHNSGGTVLARNIHVAVSSPEGNVSGLGVKVEWHAASDVNSGWMYGESRFPLSGKYSTSGWLNFNDFYMSQASHPYMAVKISLDVPVLRDPSAWVFIPMN